MEPSVRSAVGQLSGRHVLGIHGVAAEQSAGGVLSLFGFFLAMNHAGQLVSQNFLGLVQAADPSRCSISSICSSGRKVSIRMHFITSASPTLRQYW